MVDGNPAECPQSEREGRRLQALCQYDMLDTLPEPALDEITALASHICAAPISLISLVDEDRQWFKSKVGWSASQTPRDVAFCGHAIDQSDLFTVADAALDERFADNPLVTGDPYIRFYAGAPLLTPEGHSLGTLCIMDRVPRQLTASQQEALRVLSRQVMAQLELRRRTRHLAESEERLRLVAENARVGLVIVDHDRCYVYANTAYAEIFGLPAVPNAGQRVADVLPGHYEEQVRAGLDRAFAGQRVTCELRRPTAGGECHYLVRYEPAQATGLVSLVVVAITDITERKIAEDALQDKNTQLQMALVSAGMGVWSWDFRSNEVFTIQGGGPVSGLPEGCYPKTGAAFVSLVHPEDRALVGQRMEQSRAGGDYAVEFRIVLPNDEIRWVCARGQGVRDASGAVVGLTGVDHDITERRQAELHIQHLNRVYSVLSSINQTIVREKNQQTMLDSACRIAVEKGRFSMAWIGLLGGAQGRLNITAHAGATPDTLQLLNHFECAFTVQSLQNDQRSVCNDIACDALAAVWRDAALLRGYRSMVSLPLKAAERVIGTFNLYAPEPDFFDEEELCLLDELAVDISFALEIHQRAREQSQVEKALRQSEERFQQLAENIQQVFWMTDPTEQQVLYVSPAYEKIWGRTSQSLYAVPGSWLEAVHPEDLARVRQALTTQRESGKFDETYRITRPDGTLRWIHGRSSRVGGETDQILRIVGVAEDVTERRKLEEQFHQSQKMESIGQLAGGVAHDFNNILAAIMMQAELAIIDPNAPAETREMLEDIKAAAERAGSLTRQLLAFSRRQIMQPGPLELNDLVTGLIKMLQRILGEDVRLQLHLHPGALLTRADAGMLDQVLLNLVVNARDAMPGGGLLRIETGEKTFSQAEADLIPEASPGRHVWLRVTDTGLGMSPEVLTRIFEPFFTTKEPGKGTGLGLATVFGIVKQHGGALVVESEPGRGATFQIFLRAMGAADKLADKADVTSKPRGGSETILLVEDEAAVRVLTRKVLERAGYRVVEAPDGVVALRMWEERQASVHLLLTDMVMPGGVSGHALAARLQARDPQLKVIFTSGYSADFAGRELGLQPGQDFIRKPSSSQQLLETVRRCLDAF